MSEQIRLFAEYNRLMNEKIYVACSKLTAEDLTEDLGALFGTILGTLNHLIVADTIWIKRFVDLKPALPALSVAKDWDSFKMLRDLPCPDLAHWLKHRHVIDSVIKNFANEITPLHENAALEFTDMAGERHLKKFGLLLTHFFNHQTHHRGQISAMLTRKGSDIGVTDIGPLVPEL